MPVVRSKHSTQHRTISVIIPKGYQLWVSVLGRDFEFPGDGPWPAAYGVSVRGNGIFVHTD